MTEVRSKGNYEQWVKFFLQAIMESAEDATQAVDELVALHDTNVEKIRGMGCASKSAMLVFQYLEANPIIYGGGAETPCHRVACPDIRGSIC